MKKKFVTNKGTIAALKAIYTKYGILKPKTIVDEARIPTSPLHSHFEWDDSKAAEAFRIEQARSLLQVTVEYVETPGGKKPIQVFCSLTTDRAKGGYRAIVDVMSDKELRAQLLEDALDEMNRFQQKYKDLKELAGVFNAMGKARRKLAA